MTSIINELASKVSETYEYDTAAEGLLRIMGLGSASVTTEQKGALATWLKETEEGLVKKGRYVLLGGLGAGALVGAAAMYGFLRIFVAVATG